MSDDQEPGRPAVEAVFAACAATAVVGVGAVHVLARLLPPAPPAGSPPAAVPLTLAVLLVAVTFAAAQAILPGPKSAGGAGLAIPMAGAVALALRGLEPAAVVSTLFVGVFLTPAAYYMAIRLSFPLAGLLRRHPVATVLAGAAVTVLVVEAARLITFLADRASGGRFW
jgi:hypothetical protein